MSRLRYPFTEISARCRLCGAEGLTASSEHALGGRLIDWRRSHAPVCPEWPRWAENKGLQLDERGALLYPNETGPYEPRIRPKADEADSEAEEALGADGPEPSTPSASDGVPAPVDSAPIRSLAAIDDAIEALEPRVGERIDGARPRALWLVSDPELPQTAVEGTAPIVGAAEEDTEAPLPIPLPVAAATARTQRRAAESGRQAARSAQPEVDLMEVPIERLRQAELF